MNEPLAYFNGDFLPASQLAISPDDLGFLQGVAVSERLRTFRGTLFRLDEHLERLANSLQIIGLAPAMSLARIGEVAQELVARNASLLLPEDDLGMSLFITPGKFGSTQATVGIQAYPLPFGQWSTYYDQGQTLTETEIRQVPASCWPAELKCRSRMHYYLADRLADQKYPGLCAALLDQEGFVSEASTANIVFYRDGDGLVSPPREKILPGVSLSVLVELAARLGIPKHFRDFRLDELAAADEILLCSTSPCVWPVTAVNDRPVGQPTKDGEAGGPVFRRILAAWCELAGVDIAAQARQFNFRV